MKTKKIFIYLILVIFLSLLNTRKVHALDTIIKVAFNPYLPPYQFEEDGQYKGLHIDLLNIIASKNNLIVEYIPMENNSDSFDALSNGEVDMVLGVIKNNGFTRQSTEAISQSSIIMITNRKYEDITNINESSAITVLENRTISYSYIQNMKNLKYIVVSNQVRAFEMLLAGEADFMIGVKNSILYQLEKSNSQKYTIIRNYMVPIEYSIITKSGDSDIRNLINKELQRIKISGEYTKIYEKWINEDKYIIRNIMNSIAIMVLVFLAIILVNFIFNYRLNTLLKKEVDEKTKELKAINDNLQKQIIETRNNNELKNCIVEHSLSGLIAIDRNYNITLFNKSACKITGLQYFPIGDSAFNIPILRRILENIKDKIFIEDLKIINKELRIKDTDNESIIYRYGISQLYNFDNSIRGAIITIDDVTEEIKTKEQIFEREKNKALNKIIAGIAHEIRNPLTSIKAFIQLIPSKINNPNFQNQLSEIVPKEVDRVNNLIKNLIDYAKPETNNKSIIDLSEIINSCTFLINPTMKSQKIKLIVNEEDNLKLYADKNQLKQIILNIILNGFESMAEKINKFNITKNLYMNIRTYSKDDYIYIIIIDEGMGMNDEQIKKKSIIIIDDEIGICTSLSISLEDRYNVKAFTNPSEGLKAIKDEYFNICLLDLKIGEINGIEVLSEIKKIDKNIIVIIMTAYGSIDTTVEAIKKGAYTYLTKPLDVNDLNILISQALEFQRLNDMVEYLSRELKNRYEYNGIIGRSAVMKNVFKMIDKVKNVDTSVIITGDSGTGKELVARAIHYSGKRKNEKFVEVNCAAIPAGLLEEELFGHKKGSFTGAIGDSVGKFEYANNGTIFLDEIGDMPFDLQAKLLRVLQQKEYSPIGSNEKRKINIRVIAATNKDLKSLIAQGEFRQDLYFRLNVVEINLPPLEDRKQDLPLLFKHFIEMFNIELEKNIRGLSKEAEKKLLEYDYPGNVRELSNIIEYSMIMTNKEIIHVDDLPEEVILYKNENKNGEAVFSEDLIGLTLKEIEKRIIKASLVRNNGSRKLTAKMLGISDKGIRNKIKEYELY